jgi:hypothetical protein
VDEVFDQGKFNRTLSTCDTVPYGDYLLTHGSLLSSISIDAVSLRLQTDFYSDYIIQTLVFANAKSEMSFKFLGGNCNPQITPESLRKFADSLEAAIEEAELSRHRGPQPFGSQTI